MQSYVPSNLDIQIKIHLVSCTKICRDTVMMMMMMMVMSRQQCSMDNGTMFHLFSPSDPFRSHSSHRSQAEALVEPTAPHVDTPVPDGTCAAPRVEVRHGPGG